MIAQPEKRYSEEEYLEMEREADHKSGGTWFLASEAYKIGEAITLGSVGLTLNMTDIYAETEDLILL